MRTVLARGELQGSHTQNGTLSSAVTLTIPAGATGVYVQALTQNINFTMEGTTPTSTVGFTLVANDPVLAIPITTRTVLKFIEVAASATLKYQFYREE